MTRYLTGVKTNTLVINGKTVIGKDSEWPVNFLMVAHGWAYHYKEPSAMRNHCLLEAERIAKDSWQGVWQDGTNGESASGNTGGTGVKALRTYRGNENPRIAAWVFLLEVWVRFPHGPPDLTKSRTFVIRFFLEV